MPTLLHEHTLRNSKRGVETIANGFIRRVPTTASINRDVLHVIACIRNGTALPERFYRLERKTTTDEALERLGYMHLHVGDDRKDLLFLRQYEEVVILVALTDHSPFRDDPVLSTVLAQVGPAVTAAERKIDADTIVRKGTKEAQLKAGLKPRKPRPQI